MSSSDHLSEDLNALANWRSSLTLVTFLIASELKDRSMSRSECRFDFRLMSPDLIITFPFHVPLYVPLSLLEAARLSPITSDSARRSRLVRIRIPISLNTAPLIAVIFLLFTTAIGAKELREGTLGSNNIVPIDIVLFSLTVGYIARSIDASGMIRYLAHRVVTKTKGGHRLFFYLYFFFFGVGVLFGCDPVIQIGALFLTYLTQMSSNISHPRAWIHMQFAAANMASTIFISSNTTNVVIAQAFNINFARYTATVVVPVVVTAVVIFPLLLYIIFPAEQLIPSRIKLKELAAERRSRPAINPLLINHEEHIADVGDEEQIADVEGQIQQIQLERLMNPFLDKSAATIGVSLMLTCLIILLVLTALGYDDIQVFWVTLPASFVMLCWDTAVGWSHRHETREIARMAMEEIERIKAEAVRRQREQMFQNITCCERMNTCQCDVLPFAAIHEKEAELKTALPAALSQCATFATPVNVKSRLSWPYRARHIASMTARDGDGVVAKPQSDQTPAPKRLRTPLQRFDDNAMADPSRSSSLNPITPIAPETGTREPKLHTPQQVTANPVNDITVRPPTVLKRLRAALQLRKEAPEATVKSILSSLGLWFEQTLPTVAYTARHIPFSNIPFVLPLFILVQALASTGWVTIMARGWGSWVDKTGVLGSIWGMAFLSMVLCNVSHLLQLTPSIKRGNRV